MTFLGAGGPIYGQSRRGFSRGAVAAALIVGMLIGAIATYAIAGPSPSRTTTVTSTTTVTTDSTQQVMSAYAAHLKNFESENLTAMAGEYEENATLELVGSTGYGLGGQYDGAASIGTLYRTMLSQNGFATVNLANVSYAVSVSGNGGEATVNSTFTIYGSDTAFSYRIGPSVTTAYIANIRSDVSYVRLGSSWFISNETWDFLAFVVCPAITSPACSMLLTSPL